MSDQDAIAATRDEEVIATHADGSPLLTVPNKWEPEDVEYARMALARYSDEERRQFAREIKERHRLHLIHPRGIDPGRRWCHACEIGFPCDAYLAADMLEADAKRIAELEQENDDLREVAKDCTGDDHGAFCRHYKGLKKRIAELEADNKRLVARLFDLAPGQSNI